MQNSVGPHIPGADDTAQPLKEPAFAFSRTLTEKPTHIGIPYIPHSNYNSAKSFSAAPRRFGETSMPDRRRIDDLGELGNALEALINVLYLIRQDRHNPASVLALVEMAHVQLDRMTRVLQRELARPPMTEN